jgi:SAM-dependent methyltransferase
MMPDVEEQLRQTYDRRFAGLRAYRERVWSVLTREFFQNFVPDNGTILDLGCGWGEFINQIRAARKYGMDLNPSASQYLSPDVIHLHQDCSTPWALPDATLDMVFTSNFFEHLPDKDALRRTLVEALRCLKPSGRLVCLGPNIKYLPGAYWDFWDHYLPLTELSLAEGLEIVGFQIERQVPRFLPYTMSGGLNPPTWTLSLYLRVPALWPCFGRQFLVVARKP